MVPNRWSASFGRVGSALILIAGPMLLSAQSAAPTAGEYQKAQEQQIETVQGMPPSPPEDRVDAVRLSQVEGHVHLSDASGKLFSQVRLNMAVLPGMRIETENDGRAELQFPDGAVARVTPNSALELSSITRDEAGSAHVALKPLSGLTYYSLVSSANSYAIVVGPLVASPVANGAGALLRVNLDQAPYQAAVLRGTVHFEDAGRDVSYDVEQNQTSRIDPDSAAGYDVAMEAVSDTWDAWNTDRDNALARIAGTKPVSDEPGGPGWSDLDYYGSWYNVPGQGMAWAPDGVDQNFDPYGDGAWGYYSGIGYSWASNYPWGWLPYHCGSWNYFGGYGWMWQPLSCGWGYGGEWFPYSGTYGLAGYRIPPRPIPARGITHLPPAQAVLPVHRGGPVHFRGLGDPRPVARTAFVAGQTLAPVPVESRPIYGTVIQAGPAGLGYTGGLRTSQGRIGAHPGTFQPAQPSQPGPPMRVIVPRASGAVSEAPRFVPAPAPRMSAPAPPPAAPSHASPSMPSGHH